MGETIISMVQERMRKHPEKPALAHKVNGVYRDISWGELGQRVKRAALGLIALGVKPKDKVCLMSKNCPEWVVADLGIIFAGAVNVPIYHTNKGSQISYIVNDAEAEILIVGCKEKLDEIIAVRHQVPQLQKIIVISGWTGTGDAQVMSFQDLLELGASRQDLGAELDQRMAAVAENDLVSLVYTSGTTGPPKGVMLSHKNFLSNAKACQEVLDIRNGHTCLSFLPLSHVFERMAGYYLMLMAGVRIAYAESFYTVPQNLLEVRPEYAISVPRLYEKIYVKIKQTAARSSWLHRKVFQWALRVGEKYRFHPENRGPLLKLQHGLADRLVYRKIKQQLGGRIRFFVSGGAPLAKEIAEFFYALGITILEGYGLTETAPVLAVNTHKHLKFGTVGPPIPGVKIKIAEDGEILASGPNVSAGYYKKPEETAKSFRNGWFYTGDIGEIDGDGYLCITDRKKDIIVTSGGKNVAPQNIENVLKADKYISQVVVYGDRRKYLTALIVPNFENLERYARDRKIEFYSREELVNNEKVVSMMEKRVKMAQEGLPNFEQVKKFRLLPREFTQEDGELTPTLKIKRRVVAQKYRRLFESMYNPEDYAAQVVSNGKVSPASGKESISG